MNKTNTQIINKKTMVKQAINYLREYILGIDNENDKLPSENDIANKLGISRLTIREALTVLENEGLIEKNQGSSTTITTFARKLSENIDYKGELGSFIEESGAILGTEILETKFIEADEELGEKLSIEIGEEIFYLEKLFLANHKPATLCINRIPKRHISKWNFDKEDLGKSMFDLIERNSNYIFSYDSIELIPELVTEKLSQVLQVQVNKAILKTEVIKYSLEGIPIMYNSEYYVDELIRFSALRNNNGLRLGQLGSKSKDEKGELNE